MRQFAAIAVVGLVAVMAAITSVQIVRVRAEMLDDSRVQHEEFIRRFDRLERMLAAVAGRSAALPVVLPGISPGPRNGASQKAATPEALAEKLPDRAARSHQQLRVGRGTTGV
jgi:hypothetical protein